MYHDELHRSQELTQQSQIQDALSGYRIQYVNLITKMKHTEKYILMIIK